VLTGGQNSIRWLAAAAYAVAIASSPAHADSAPLVEAMEVPSADLIMAQVVGLPPGHAVRANLGALRPTAGSSFAILSTGAVGQPPQGGVDMGRGGPQDDEVVFILQLRPPPSAKALQFDFFFLSAEYPEFVGSSYNDLFSAEVSGPAWSGDAARDHNDNPISINNVFFEVTSFAPLMGTGFGFGVGGGTGWLTATIPAAPGEPLTLTLRVRDVNDGIFDSMVLLDHFRWSGETVTEAGLLRVEDTGGTGPIDTSSLPVSCVVGQDCAGEVSATQPGRITVTAGGRPVGEGAGSASVSVTPDAPGDLPLTIQLIGEDGSVVTVTHQVAVVPPLSLSVPASLDLGTVVAGTPTLSEAACTSLGVSGEGLDQNTFRLDFAPADGCQSRPALRFVSAGGWEKAVRLPTENYALSEDTVVCLVVPYCAGEVGEGTITITPADARFAAQAADISVRWEVTARSWLACNAWWLALVGGTLLLVWVFVGVVRPARFSREASIAVAGSDKGLRRAAPQLLRECSGARAGFYRDAALGVHADGSTSGRLRGSLLTLRARRRGEIVLSGAVQVVNRRSRKLETPEDLAQGHVPLPGVTYRAGELWIRFEGL